MSGSTQVATTTTSVQELANEFLTRSKPTELLTVHLLDNARVLANTVGGGVYTYHPNAPIRDDSPLLSCPERLFGQVMVAEVLDVSVDEQCMRQRLQKCSAQIKTSAERRFSLLKTLEENQNNECMIDSSSWDCQLGPRGLVGLYKGEKECSIPSYYLVVRTDSDYVGQELISKFVQPRLGQVSYEALLESPVYLLAADQAQRNAQRLLAQVADLLQLKVLLKDDAYAYVEPGSHRAPPVLALPSYAAVSNQLRRVGGFGKQAGVAFYSRCTQLTTTPYRAVPYLVSPRFGLVLYFADPERSYRHAGPFGNQMMDAFPTGTGRLADKQAVEENKRRLARDKPSQDFTNLVVYWKGRTTAIAAVTHERVHAYGDWNEQRREKHANQLGAAYGHLRLSPISVVMAPPSV